MPIDQYEDEDEGGSKRGRGPTEFDCPSCSAHNPVGELLVEGAEVLCNYCGTEFQVRFNAEGRLKLRER